MRIRSKDIANALGISESTVSLVLNNRPGVKKETREKVSLYLQELGNKVNNHIKAESLNEKGTLLMLYYIKHGIIMRRDSSQSRPRFFDEIETLSNQAGYRFLYEEFQESSMNLEDAILRWKEKNVKGIYIMAAEMNRSDAYLFSKLDIPIVVGDNLFYDLGMDSFLIDNADGIRRGVDYLIDRGHSNIVYMAEDTDIFNFKERRNSFIEEMETRQCGNSKNRICHLGNTLEEICFNTHAYLDKYNKKTSAMVLESSLVSLGVSKALLERNVRVPKDISLVGFDALPELSLLGLDLTLIKGTHTKRHLAAVKHLLQHLLYENDEDEMIRVYYRTRILEGNSVFDKTKYIYK